MSKNIKHINLKIMNIHLRVLLCLLYPGLLAAQQTSLSGKVVSDAMPVAFAQVSIVESDVTAVTDLNGDFELTGFSLGKYRLLVYAPGFEPLQIEVHMDVTSLDSLVVELEPLSEMLTEVVLESEQSGLQRQTPYNLSSVNLQGILQQHQPNGIMGILKQEPGIYGAEMGQGIVKPFIRGLGFSRVVSLYQGNKLENHQWGGDHGLGINDLGIKSVEVIKGPASVLYGSGALGGVIIAIDQDAYTREQGFSGSLSTSFNSLSNGFRTTASVGGKTKDSWFGAADIGYEQHADYHAGGGQTIGNSRFRIGTLRLHAGVEKENFNNRLSFTYNAQQLGIISDMEMLEGHSLATTAWDYNEQLPFQEVEDYLLSYNQSTKGEHLDTYFHFSHHLNDRREIESAMDEIDLGLKQHHTFLNLRLSWKDKKLLHQLGVQGSLIKTENYDQAIDLLIPDAEVFETGLFYMSSIDVGPYFLQGALRYDYRNVSAYAKKAHFIDTGFVLPGAPENRVLSKNFSGFTGSIGATRRLGRHHTFKLNFATGFRAPDLAELFSNGPHPGTSRFERGNIDFDREQTYQLDVQYEFRSDTFSGFFSAYGMQLQDYIFFRDTGERMPENDLDIWAYYQEDVRFYGMDLELSWRLNNRWRSKLTGSLVRANEIVDKQPLSMIPPDNMGVGLTFSALHDHSLQLSGRWQLVAAQNRTAVTEDATTGYGLINLLASKNFYIKENRMLDISLTVENLFDKRYVDHLSLLRAFEIPGTGRNLRLALKFSF